jgi:subtilisin family serine protease
MMASRAVFVVVLVAGASVGTGCGGGSGAVTINKIVPQSSSQQQNVMVIDEGIDLSASDLQGRVAAAYTETCADDSSDAGVAGPGGVVDGGPAFDALKQMYLAALSHPDDSCHLTTGISAKHDPLASIAQYKSRWNAMVRANQTPPEAFSSAEIMKLMNPINTEFSSFGYHGTATATTVAHENSDVRLVLVERELGSESSLQTNFPCIAQSDINQIVDLLNDPQVYAAFVNQPAQIDGELAAAQSMYDVGIVNESFGAASREALETLQKMYCPVGVDLAAYFALLDKVTNDHNATINGPALLTVVAAGNDGSRIDSGSDSLSCDLGDPKSLLVGAYNPISLAQNMFSDYGACVNVFAPGQAIVVEYGGGWLTWASGTSFSAPLTARYASMTATSPFDPTAERAAVVAKADPTSHFLPVSVFPSDFFYVPGTDYPEFVVPAAGAKVAPVVRPPTKYELHRVFGPLNRLKRLRAL